MGLVAIFLDEAGHLRLEPEMLAPAGIAHLGKFQEIFGSKSSQGLHGLGHFGMVSPPQNGGAFGGAVWRLLKFGGLGECL